MQLASRLRRAAARPALRRAPAMAVALALAQALAPASAATAAPGPDPAADAARPPYWRERSSFFHAIGGHADVVMLGDSLTDGAEWRELFPAQAIVNRGIDGDTADGVRARLADVLALRPRTVFLMIGINDLADGGRSVDAVAADIRAIVARLATAGVQVVLQSTLPCNVTQGAWKSCATLNPRVAQLDARLAAMAPARFVDLRPALAGPGGLQGALTFDGVHLGGEGYRRWRDTIAPLMPRPTPGPAARGGR